MNARQFNRRAGLLCSMFRTGLRSPKWAGDAILKEMLIPSIRENCSRIMRKGSRIDRPIFIVGLQRGGLTLISRILRRNKNVVSVCGNHHRWYGRDEMCDVLGFSLPEKLRLLNSRHSGALDFGRGMFVYGTDKFFNYYRNTEDDCDDTVARSLRRAIRKSLLRHAEDPMSARFLDKSQIYGLKMPMIQEALKEFHPQFLLVARDPHVLCAKASGLPDVTTLASSQKERIQLACQHYRNCIDTILNDGKKMESFDVIRFEDFLSEPEKTIRESCSFLDLQFDLDMLPSAQNYDSRQAGKWYPLRQKPNMRYWEQLDDEQRRMISAECADIALRLGYQIPS